MSHGHSNRARGLTRRGFLASAGTVIGTAALGARPALASGGREEITPGESWLADLEAPEAAIRLEAVWKLGREPRQDERARHALVRSLADPDRDVRLHSAWALARGRFEDEGVRHALRRATEDRSSGVRMAAREALDQLFGGDPSGERSST